jgi:hypothetical protein
MILLGLREKLERMRAASPCTRRKILIGGYVLALLRDRADEPEAAAIRAGFKTFVEDAKRPDYSQLFSEFFAEPSPK